MANWYYCVKEINPLISHCDSSSDESITETFKQIGDILEKSTAFRNFYHRRYFKKIPQRQNECLADAADRLLEKLYDYADSYRIWLG